MSRDIFTNHGDDKADALGLPEREPEDILHLCKMPGLDHPVGLVQHEKAQPFNLNSQLVVLASAAGQ